MHHLRKHVNTLRGITTEGEAARRKARAEMRQGMVRILPLEEERQEDVLTCFPLDGQWKMHCNTEWELAAKFCGHCGCLL